MLVVDWKRPARVVTPSLSTPRSFGERVRETRRVRHLTQSAAAAAAGVSVSSWRRYERGERPPRDVLERIAGALDVAPAWLLHGREPGFGKRLREARRLRGWTQKMAAAQTGVSLRSWENYEADLHLPRKALPMIALALNVSPAWLLHGRDLAADDGDVVARLEAVDVALETLARSQTRALKAAEREQAALDRRLAGIEKQLAALVQAWAGFSGRPPTGESGPFTVAASPPSPRPPRSRQSSSARPRRGGS
jgi:transcriptional regulator with XRE-family HTH domain